MTQLIQADMKCFGLLLDDTRMWRLSKKGIFSMPQLTCRSRSRTRRMVLEYPTVDPLYNTERKTVAPNVDRLLFPLAHGSCSKIEELVDA